MAKFASIMSKEAAFNPGQLSLIRNSKRSLKTTMKSSQSTGKDIEEAVKKHIWTVKNQKKLPHKALKKDKKFNVSKVHLGLLYKGTGRK